ncbi:MAG TPA: hypothetical protein PKA95_18030 [Thermomicrobiales bacterium]|nr:hypothetical protein [Thermomicrobiales bacterium]
MSATEFTLADGSRVAIAEATVTLIDQRGAPTPVDCSQITTVSRGGTELIVARREADPFVFHAMSLEDARAIEQALERSCGISPLHRPRWDPGRA